MQLLSSLADFKFFRHVYSSNMACISTTRSHLDVRLLSMPTYNTVLPPFANQESELYIGMAAVSAAISIILREKGRRAICSELPFDVDNRQADMNQIFMQLGDPDAEQKYSKICSDAYDVIFKPSNHLNSRKSALITACRTQMIHTFPLLLVSNSVNPGNTVPLLISGMIFFCGPCYHYAITGNQQIFEYRWIGVIVLSAAWISFLARTFIIPRRTSLPFVIIGGWSAAVAIYQRMHRIDAIRKEAESPDQWYKISNVLHPMIGTIGFIPIEMITALYPDDPYSESREDVLSMAFDYHLMHSFGIAASPFSSTPILTASLFAAGIIIYCIPCYDYSKTGNPNKLNWRPLGELVLYTGWISLIPCNWMFKFAAIMLKWCYF